MDGLYIKTLVLLHKEISNMNTLTRSLVISLIIAFLTACGGGGGSNGSPSGTAPDNTTAGSVIWDTKVTYAPINGSSAIATDGTIYVFTQNAYGVTGRLIALNPDGSKKWEFDVGADFVGSFSTPSIADDGTIYVGANNGLVAINPNGTGKWTYPVLSYANSPSIATDGTIYISESAGFLSAVNPDGSLKWTVSMGNNVNIFQDGIAIAPNGILYLSTDDDLVRSYTAAGVLRWTYNANRSGPNTPAITGDSGEIYVSYDDGFVVALDNSGVSKWTQDLGGNKTPALTFSSNNMIYAVSGDFLYKINPVDGAAIWSYNAGNNIRTTPAIGDDEVIYFADVNAKLFAVNAQGTIEWFSDSASLFATQGSPVIGDNGIIYYTTAAGRVRAVGSSSTKPNTGCAMFMCNARHTGRI